MKAARSRVRPLPPARALAVVAGICLVVAGCQAIENERVDNTEALLRQAGFQARYADKPERLEDVKALEQRALIRKERDGEPYYVYADARGCQCLYYGTPAEYRAYRTLENDQEIAANDRLNEVMNNAAAQRYYGLWYGENAMPDTPPPPGVLPPL